MKCKPLLHFVETPPRNSNAKMSTMTERSAPSTAAIAISTAIIGALIGYFLGQGSSLFGAQPAPAQHAASSDTDLSDDDTNELDADDDGELNDFAEAASQECKLVLVVRTDLGMTKGKYIQSSPLQYHLQ